MATGSLAIMGDGEAAAQPTLGDRFLVPPFSVLNARQGFWQNRKRAWLRLGIQSEVGRGENLLKMSDQILAAQAGDSPYDGKGGKKKRAPQSGRLTFAAGAVRKDEVSKRIVAVGARKMVGAGLVMHGGYGPVSQEIEGRGGGTSIFDPVLCELAYRWFCPPGGHVLDPFAGGSVRGIVAARLGRNYTGVELRQEQVDANEAQRALATPGHARWVQGDSRRIKKLAAGEYDMVWSCPPYADLEKYSDDPRDLSNMGYEEFREAYRKIIARSLALLRQDRFAAFVVGEVRAKKEKAGGYVGFVPDTIRAFEDAGARFYNEAFLITAVGSLPLRVAKAFGASRKLGKTHQNLLVFVKGDPKKAAKACGGVQVGEVPRDWAAT